MARLKSCAYCGRVHASDKDCGKKPKREKESTDITRLRTCRRWDKKRGEVLERDHYLCRVCLARHRFTYDGLEVHHIVPLTEDSSRAYDNDNLITLCTHHHKAADAGRIDRDILRELARQEGIPPGGGAPVL